jgi:thiol-disulfide isomerase/thioredoxin
VYQENYFHVAGKLIPKIYLQSENNTFKIHMKKGEKFVYFSIISIKKDSRNVFTLIDYIAQPGDKIIISIVNRQLTFSGTGYAKYKVRYEYTNVNKEWYQNFSDSLNKARPKFVQSNKLDSLAYSQAPQDLKDQIAYDYSKLNYDLHLTEQYKQEISPFIFSVMKANLLAKTDLAILSSYLIRHNQGINNISESYRALIRNELAQIYNQHGERLIKLIPESIRIYSEGYSAFMVDKLYSEDTLGKSSFQWVKNNLTGEIRDRSFLQYFSLYYHINKNNDENLAKALGIIKNDHYKELLLNLYSSSIEGAAAYNFALPDSSGKIFKLADFKGKTVVLDFWFTGCVGCEGLAYYMKDIEKSLKNNPLIKFISINIDKDKSKWINSVKSHRYTGEESLDLYTEGLAGKHPFIDFYKIVAYPTLIIIDKDGKIITTNPEKPVDKLTANKFTELLKNTVNKQTGTVIKDPVPVHSY